MSSRLATLVVMLVGTRSAVADPDESSRAFFRASLSPTAASFHRELTYSGFVSGPGDLVMENTVDTTRVGGQVELAAGVQVTARIQLGGAARYALIPNVEDGRFGATGSASLDYLVLGPQATVFATRHLYVRGEVALGRMSQHIDVPDASYYGLSTGVELGYGTLIDGRFVQFGLAASMMRVDDQEQGDHGTYDDHFRLVTVSAVLSMNLGKHP